MILARTFTIVAVGAMLAVAASPAGADQRRGRGDQGNRGGQRAARPAPRPMMPAAPQGRRAVPAPRGPIGSVPGGSRSWGYRQGPVFYGARGWYPYRSYAPRVRYASPYYTFRPRVSVGIGLWVGFPVPFPVFGYGSPYSYGPAYGYPAPYPYPYPYPYPVPYPVPYGSPYPATSYPQAPAQGAVSAAPVSYGGVSFQITPADAEVWVDGGYAGRANEFDPGAQPLSLAPGVHRVELRAPGHRTLVFDVTITAGQVVPYQGSLQPGY